MIRLLCILFFKITGWKVIGPPPPDRAVIVGAPHTSNWDYPFALGVFYIRRLKVKYLAKDSLFKFPLGIIMRGSGGIPVDRSKKNNMVEYMVSFFKEDEKILLLVPVEGTRGYVKEWKSGFYHVAMQANVPILLGFLDFKRKEAGFGPLFYPTGDYAKDLAAIKEFYKDKTAKYPEKSSLYEPPAVN
jgi:1-acyl-sn-glycerol-3-phosphate acyltransferase